VEIAPADATKLGVANGDAVKLVSPAGEVTLPAHLQPDAVPGTLFVPNHFAEPAVNRLLSRGSAVDRVRVEKL
jgi:anaerobic selenocysteine-containing dehydrogenase